MKPKACNFTWDDWKAIVHIMNREWWIMHIKALYWIHQASDEWAEKLKQWEKHDTRCHRRQ